MLNYSLFLIIVNLLIVINNYVFSKLLQALLAFQIILLVKLEVLKLIRQLVEGVEAVKYWTLEGSFFCMCSQMIE